MPVLETNGEEWDRLEPASALDVLVELVLHGDYNGVESAKRTKSSLELRAAAVNVFEVCLFCFHSLAPEFRLTDPQNFVHQEEIKVAIVQAMLPPDDAGSYLDSLSRLL